MIRRLVALLALATLSGCAASQPFRPPVTFVTERGRAGVVFQPQATSEDEVDALFAGSHRKGPKTSVVELETEEEFGNLEDFLETLPSDWDMIESFEALVEETGNASDKFSETRLPDEERSVRVKAWLFAAKFESDKDFHLIIGSSSKKATAEFFNVEVSGLPNPETEDTPTLRNVRAQLLDILGTFPGKRYSKLSTPLPVEVEGALFYDIDHGPGVVGPLGMRPTTSWEIHPITDLQNGHD